MTESTYKEAHKLQEEIARIAYELEVMEQNLRKRTSIRFGTNFNVSIPIEFDNDIYEQLITFQMDRHLILLQTLKDKFNSL